jgi:hypothetical protein
MAFNAMYCHRHIEIIQALGTNFSALTLLARR